MANITNVSSVGGAAPPRVSQVISIPGNHNPADIGVPPGRPVTITISGGGGGGGKGGGDSNGGGGGASGAFVSLQLTADQWAALTQITVGAGGAADTGLGGGNGDDSTLVNGAGIVVAAGGGTGANNGGKGLVGGTIDVIDGVVVTYRKVGTEGNAPTSSAGGAGAANGIAGAGGTGATTDPGVGGAGLNLGAGGGGGFTTTTGGNGGAGAPGNVTVSW